MRKYARHLGTLGWTGGSAAERSRDWLDQAVGDLEHARHDLEHGFTEAERLIGHADAIVKFCSGLLSPA